MSAFFAQYWPHLVLLAHVAIGLVAATHVLFTKREVRAAIGWVGIIWLTPIFGSWIYFLLGINRVTRRRLRSFRRSRPPGPLDIWRREFECSKQLSRALDGAEHLRSLEALMGRISGRPLESGNCIVPLDGGDVAYPSMLSAIRGARRSIAFSSYIIDNDAVGRMFVQALAEAHRRGVQVRVLIDAVGSRYTLPPITYAMRRADLPYTQFMPTQLPWRFQYANLRNHRKILIVDGRLAFTGGMNIRGGCMCQPPGCCTVQDVHFQIEGPLVAHLWEVFFYDWASTAGEVLEDDIWQPDASAAAGCDLLARGISAGPDRDLEKVRLAYLGAIGLARTSIQIVTPYFVPDESLVTALGLAAMRGVAVDVIVPQKNNLYLVQWASTAPLAEIVEQGCRVWESPPPFDHSKLMVVDGVWSFIGSANWDARSLRLNFELNVECYSPCFARSIASLIQRRQCTARRLEVPDFQNRHLAAKIRDRVAWLLSPYL